ncbi:MAG TPA: winged helix DNA-binding domain-containing protein [Anaerolineales bacterium]|nr:winged helix DNA-binding domain-containing protein [Anaerolineales bacterium]
MTLDIVRHRLHNQSLSQTKFTNPIQVVEQLGAVQSQDYAGAKWALAQRLKNMTTDAILDKAFNEGKILRTHVMRPTWHFVAPKDIRWLLMLTASRVHAGSAFMYRQLELDETVIRKSYKVLEKALQGNKQMTRTELGIAFAKAGIAAAEGQRLGYFMMSAELDGVICSGGRKGKQFTYALLEERVPPVKPLKRDEALAQLVKRYFTTRGPATLHDFTWWSGLTMADAKQGIEMVKSDFINEEFEGRSYWLADTGSLVREKSPTAHLLPNYDEYFIGFKDRSAIGEIARQAGIKGDDPSLIAHVVILNGQIVGGWRRTLTKNAVILERNLFKDLTRSEERALAREADRFSEFLQLPVEWM